MPETIHENINSNLQDFSSQIDNDITRVSIILAAGHGRRIRSEKSKMLHEIWGVPTVLRVADAVRTGLNSENQIVVVGKKAKEVVQTLGNHNNRIFTHQHDQLGTGDAVRIGIQPLTDADFDGDVYVFPGDMGLLTKKVVSELMADFKKNDCDMIVLTAEYHGDPELNYYGRILRVPSHDINGNSSGDDFDKVIEIKEHRDIIETSTKSPYKVQYNSREYEFSRNNLIEINEFNTGVYVFKLAPFKFSLSQLKNDNAQNEFYMTDMIKIFNQNALTVRSVYASDSSTVLGFNNKSVLKEMDRIAGEKVYDQLKDIITIDDKDDFFIDDNVVSQIIEMDKKYAPLDIVIGKGVYIGTGVVLNRGVNLRDRVYLSGNIELGKNVRIHENVMMTTFPDQTLSIGDNSEIFQGNIFKGNLEIGVRCRIESGVNITGSDDHPTKIDDHVLIKGTSYLFGCKVDENVIIEHSVLKCKYIEKTIQRDGNVKAIRWILPMPEGLDSIHPLE